MSSRLDEQDVGFVNVKENGQFAANISWAFKLPVAEDPQLELDERGLPLSFGVFRWAMPKCSFSSNRRSLIIHAGVDLFVANVPSRIASGLSTEGASSQMVAMPLCVLAAGSLIVRLEGEDITVYELAKRRYLARMPSGFRAVGLAAMSTRRFAVGVRRGGQSAIEIFDLDVDGPVMSGKIRIESDEVLDPELIAGDEAGDLLLTCCLCKSKEAGASAGLWRTATRECVPISREIENALAVTWLRPDSFAIVTGHSKIPPNSTNRQKLGVMSSQIYTVNKHSGKATMVLELDNTLVTAISASNDGKLVAIGTSKGDVVLADTATFRSLRRFSGYRRPVTDIGFLGASDHLFSADAGGLVVGWNTRVN